MGKYKKEKTKSNRVKKILTEYEKQKKRHEAFLKQLQDAGISDKWLNYEKLNLLEPIIDNPFDNKMLIDGSKLQPIEKLKEIAKTERLEQNKKNKVEADKTETVEKVVEL